MTEPNSSFSRQFPTVQIAWDSTSLGAYKKCPRFYELSIIQGWQTRAQSVDLRFGILYHGATERYDHARAQGQDHQTALRTAIRWTLEQTWEVALGRAWASGDNNKNRGTLVRTLVWYLDQFGENDPFETVILANGKPAVELSFRMDLDYKSHLTGEQFILCGHLDRLANFQQKTYIVDKKTTRHTLSTDYFDQFSPDNQFSLYPFAGRIVYKVPIAGIVCDAAQVAVTFSRFERQQIPRSDEQLDEWHRELGFWLTAAQLNARTGHWPQNDKACFRCHFRSVCSKPPSVREQWLQAGFVKRTWDPLQARGDI